MPRISVLIPVFNGQKDLAETLESVLQQTYDDWEMIAIDDGSSDRTPEILVAYGDRDRRIRVVRQDNAGITKALNAGITHVRGDYVARLDCGDICVPERFERQTSFLEAHPDVVVVGSFAERVTPEGWPVDVCRPPCDHEAIDGLYMSGHGGGILHTAAMIRGTALQEVKGYREEFTCAQDTDLWLRLGETGRLANIPEVLLVIRHSLFGISSSMRSLQIEMSRRAIHCARERRGLQALEEPPQRWLPEGKADLIASWARSALLEGHYGTASRCAWKALLRKPDWLMVRVLLRALALRTVRQNHARKLHPAQEPKEPSGCPTGNPEPCCQNENSKGKQE
ncbi:MAG: glycosyltransferase [Kiritimatiellia bacterium]|jgi:glycosyltransferase involved in cell wall biosynthesis|nr:glycosyltransferase [Kiritimatiellia bacterium]